MLFYGVRPMMWFDQWQGRAAKILTVLALATAVTVPPAQAQSGNGQNPTPPANSQPADEIPDAPSAVQPPPKPALPESQPAPNGPESGQTAPSETSHSNPARPQSDQTAPPPMPPIETVPPGTASKGQTQFTGAEPKNAVNPTEGLYKIVKEANYVFVPVMVKDSQGRRVDGLNPSDFTVLENGQKQTLKFFTSDPYTLSVAIVLDLGMPDVAVQKVAETYSALVGALSPYDEAALYTYSSSVSQQVDFTRKSQRLTAELDELKTVRGAENGPPVLTGPMSGEGPYINGAPAGGPLIAPVNTPPRESHVLNDAILRAAQDLGRRDPARRRIIFVISDGREMGSSASYKEVLRVLESRNIQVKAVVVDMGSLPGYRQVEKIHHLLLQGYSDILPKYTYATGGGEVLHELSRNAIEDAYSQVTDEARNQYTLGYYAQPTKGSAAYRSIDVLVDRKGLKISAKDGYYPAPSTSLAR
jgi:VWFA-related protein